MLLSTILFTNTWISYTYYFYNSLKAGELLLYEFNNAQYNMTRKQLDEISHNFPNLTETAMPIKAMKARYYYLQGKKEEAHEMAMRRC